MPVTVEKPQHPRPSLKNLERAYMTSGQWPPLVKKITAPDGSVRWRACGAGYCTEHLQKWQAEVMLHALLGSCAAYPRVVKAEPDEPGETG